MTLVVVEWGTVRLRARLLSPAGQVIETRAVDCALAGMDRAAIAGALHDVTTGWAVSDKLVLLSGMIGSSIGWGEIPRVPCPADCDSIARGAVTDRIGEIAVTFLPGLSCRSRFGDADVLRGEELVAAGVLETLADGTATLLSVPGMHGKWMSLAAAKIIGFSTAMTVDLHRLLAGHSILAPLMHAPPDDHAAFAQGVRLAYDGGGLARLLFAARSKNLLEGMSDTAASAYLWGVLIGADIREHAIADAAVLVSGEASVAALFAAAIRQVGGQATLIDTDAISARGGIALASRINDGDRA